jgi:biopolymer transport protein ExbB
MHSHRLHRVVALFLAASFLALAVAGPAHAWWDGKWKYRKKIVLDATPQGGDVKEALSDFPVLVRLHAGDFTFENAKSDGADVRLIASDDKTPLKYRIEQCDQKQGIALIWVKVPNISPASNEGSFWIYYGNAAASAGGDAGAVFDASQLAVYHLSEKEGLPQDATSYKNNATECTGKLGVPSPIGSGLSLKGGTDRLVVANGASFDFAKGFTFSAWVRVSRPENGRLFSREDGKQSMIVALEGTKVYASFSDKNKKTTTDKVDLPLSKWVHVAVTAAPGKEIAIYADGRQRATTKLAGPLPAPSADLVFGAGFAGDLDEIGIAGIARSAAWVHAEAASQGPDAPFLSFQEEESSSGGGENLTAHLLVVTARAITLDGWLIIGCIVVMIAITWILFVNKFALVRKLKKDNAAFAESFSACEEVLSVNEDFEDSSLFRVYSSGLEELTRRKVKEKRLSGQALTAFRATLDKAALQESKRNTAGLLLFTLSISGGPFMGLFGTVWGVINTFAGVAEAGEANLAAIAPGVASALACTLMGLMLAIPALFQYSYLSAEIKNLSADMGIFMDEFTNRVEEEYGEKR